MTRHVQFRRITLNHWQLLNCATVESNQSLAQFVIVFLPNDGDVAVALQKFFHQNKGVLVTTFVEELDVILAASEDSNICEFISLPILLSTAESILGVIRSRSMGI